MTNQLGPRRHAGLKASSASREFRVARRLLPAVAVEESTSARRLVGASEWKQSAEAGRAALLRPLPISAAGKTGREGIE